MNLNSLLAETGLRAIATARTKLAPEINAVQKAQAQTSRDAVAALLSNKTDPATWTAEEHVMFLNHLNHGPVLVPVLRATAEPKPGAGRASDASLDAEIPF